jgi:hypothetical protein
MAGSYNHAVAHDGQLLCNEHFVQMVENLGDAYETAEEMYGMIWWLAAQLSAAYISTSAEFVADARRQYKVGLTISPGTDGQLPEED